MPVIDSVPALIWAHPELLQVIPDIDSVELLATIDVSPASADAAPVIDAPLILIFPSSVSAQDVPPSHPNTSISDPLPTILDILSAATVPEIVAFCIFIEPILPEEQDTLPHCHSSTINDVPLSSAVNFVIPILSLTFV
jgi:hypothetical protein